MINAEIKTLVNSLKLIGNPDGPGASAPDLSPVCIYGFKIGKNSLKYVKIMKNSLKIGKKRENDQISKKSIFTNFRDMMTRFGLDENTPIGVLLDAISSG